MVANGRTLFSVFVDFCGTSNMLLYMFVLMMTALHYVWHFSYSIAGIGDLRRKFFHSPCRLLQFICSERFICSREKYYQRNMFSSNNALCSKELEAIYSENIYHSAPYPCNNTAVSPSSMDHQSTKTNQRIYCSYLK